MDKASAQRLEILPARARASATAKPSSATRRLSTSACVSRVSTGTTTVQALDDAPMKDAPPDALFQHQFYFRIAGLKESWYVTAFLAAGGWGEAYLCKELGTGKCEK